MRSTIVAAAIATGIGCGGGVVSPSPPPAAAGSYSSAHFRFEYTALDAANIISIADAVEREYLRIIADLHVGDMPIVTVTLYLDHAAMAAAVRPVVGGIPASASGLVTSAGQIHMISPNAPAWGPFDRMLSGLVHEFAHCVSLRLNPRFGNNPRWLWEAVAIYESRQAVDLRSVGYMAALSPPPFETLNGFDNTRVYEVGYSIAEFIVDRWGQRALSDLVVANGDTVAVLGLPLADFERAWFAFARARYGF